MDSFSQIRTLMVNIFNVIEDEITLETSREDLESWDSLQHLNLMLALEQEFDLTLDVDDLGILTSVDAILRYLNSKCPSK